MANFITFTGKKKENKQKKTLSELACVLIYCESTSSAQVIQMSVWSFTVKSIIYFDVLMILMKMSAGSLSYLLSGHKSKQSGPDQMAAI